MVPAPKTGVLGAAGSTEKAHEGNGLWAPWSTKSGAQVTGCGFGLSNSKIKEDSFREVICGP